MDFLTAILLGVIQGLTEFLPISSSGHLVIFQNLFGIHEPQILFDVVLHVGTLLAVLFFYRHDILLMARDGYREFRLVMRSGLAAANPTPHTRFLLMILVALIPTGIMGVGFRGLFEELFASVRAVAILLLVNGVLLHAPAWWARLRRAGAPDPSAEFLSVRDALWVGLAQGVAIAPGISRSGATISAGLLRGLRRETAVKFSFLMSVPAIVGAVVLELARPAVAPAAGVAYFLCGGITAFLVGLLALRALVFLIQRGNFHYFSYYSWALGLTALFV